MLWLTCCMKLKCIVGYLGQNRPLCHYLDLSLLFWWFCICLTWPDQFFLLHGEGKEILSPPHVKGTEKKELVWPRETNPLSCLLKATLKHVATIILQKLGKNLGDPQWVSRNPRNPLKPPMYLVHSRSQALHFHCSRK